MKLSLRNKFLFPTITLIVVGMGLSVIMTDRSAKKAIEDMAIAQIEQLADSCRNQIDFWLNTARLQLDWLAGDSILRSTNTEDSVFGSSSRDLANARLEAIKKKYVLFDYLLMMSKEGTLLATSEPSSEHAKIEDDLPVFQGMLQNKQEISEAFVSTVTASPAFSISTVLAQGKNSKILIGVVRISYIRDTFITPLSFGQTGYGYMLDRDGVALIHPSEKYIMSLELKDSEFGQTMMKTVEGTVSYEFEGRLKKAAFRTIGRTGWKIVVVSDTNELFAPARRISLLNMSVAFVMILLAGGVSYLIAKTVTKPLGGEPELMADMAQRIADGELDMVFRGSGKAETGLYAAMKNMVNTLSDVSKEIERVIQYVRDGRLDQRGDVEAFRGGWRDLIVGLNTLVDTFVAPISESFRCIERMARGDVPERITTEYQGDFRRMTGHLNALIDSTCEVTTIARQIAGGNLRVTVEPRSERDELMVTLRQMTGYLQDVADVAGRVSENDLEVSILPKSEDDVLNRALQRMVVNLHTTIGELEKSMRDLNEQNWLRSGQAELSNVMRGEQEEIVLAQNVIAYLAKYTGAQIGALYVAREQNDETQLQLFGTYAYFRRKGVRSSFRMGESLVGQAALEQETILFSNIPEEYLAVGSGLGETVPKQILVTPFMHEGELQGVFELGTSGEFSQKTMVFLQQAAENIGIAFHSAKTRQKMEALLEATRRQADALQTQQEELRASNEELENQAQTLRASEQQLQQQQEELRQTNEELEQQTRTLELQQTEMQEKNHTLQQAQREIEEKARDLEQSSKYKSEFLANMSHELRTPLNSLLILAKLLIDNKEQNLTEKQVDFARTIHKSGSELLVLINEVLDLSKVEAGRMELNLEHMSLHSLAGYVEQHFLHVAEEKELSLQVELSPELPSTIYSDRQRVEQVVKNLLSNAFKFTKQGGIRVEITRPSEDVIVHNPTATSENMVAINVFDTGIGIPAEKLQHIFEAFQQVDGTTSRQYGGTGLGLSISRELSKLLGGELYVTSEKGRGSRFTLVLPERLTEHEQSGQADRSGEERGAVSKGVRSRDPSVGKDRQQQPVEQVRDDRLECQSGEKSILIIEDDPRFAKILFDLAREKGFNGLVAGDGAAGLQLAYQYLPNAILLDLGLPDMDGKSVLEKLQANPDTVRIPTHIISAQDSLEDLRRLGAFSVLTKPVSAEELDSIFTSLGGQTLQQSHRILIVEDDAVARRSLAEALKEAKVDIETSARGEEALRLLQNETYHCLILDLGLEDMSGFELLEKIRSIPSLEILPIVVYTGKDLSKDEERVLDTYAESTIIKGIKSQERLLDEVTLFLRQVESQLPEEQQRGPRMHHYKDVVFHDKTILIVDDDMRNVYALSNVLDDKGLNVLTAENGQEALEQLDEYGTEIDLVLMDIMMPEMDGYQAIEHIRKQTLFAKLPIIALTAKAMKGDRQRCLEVGANDYLSKPIDIDKLLSLLRVWLY